MFHSEFSFLGNEAEVEGTLSVQPQANPVEGFEEYFLSLKPQTNIRNPWFKGEYILQTIMHTQMQTQLKKCLKIYAF